MTDLPEVASRGEWNRVPARGGTRRTRARGFTAAGLELSEHAAAAMTADQLTPEQKARGGLTPGFFDDRSWGFGLAVQGSGAYGWDGGLGTTWLVDPNHDLTVVCSRNECSKAPSRRGSTKTCKPRRTRRLPDRGMPGRHTHRRPTP